MRRCSSTRSLPFEIDLSSCNAILPSSFRNRGKSVYIQLSFLTATIKRRPVHLIRLENVRMSFVTYILPNRASSLMATFHGTRITLEPCTTKQTRSYIYIYYQLTVLLYYSYSLHSLLKGERVTIQNVNELDILLASFEKFEDETLDEILIRVKKVKKCRYF